MTTLAVFVIAVYAGLQMIADIASLKIGLVAGFAVDMGTFIYPLTFTMRDVAHKLLGKRNVRALIVATAAINLLMALYLWLCGFAPGAPEWGLNEEFSAVLAPVWRIVVASIVAEVASEFADTEVYHWFRAKTPRFQWARVLLSNCVSIPIDNLIFAVGAFAWALPWEVVWQIFFFNLAVKALVGVAGIPLIYLIPDRLDQFDKLDKKQR